jgi:hypothetical protein
VGWVGFAFELMGLWLGPLDLTTFCVFQLDCKKKKKRNKNIYIYIYIYIYIFNSIMFEFFVNILYFEK